MSESEAKPELDLKGKSTLEILAQIDLFSGLPQQHLRRVAPPSAVPTHDEESELPLPTWTPLPQGLDTLEFRPSDERQVLLPGRVF